MGVWISAKIGVFVAFFIVKGRFTSIVFLVIFCSGFSVYFVCCCSV